tara:strand:- start:1811 stop:3070 length:1260 start_codon:yes stop_codon:yes gene_type:complete
MARTADEVLELNQILQEINIPDRDVSVKGATSKQVTYVVKSDDRDGTKSDVEGLISRIGRVYEEQRSVSSIPVSCVRMSDGTVLTFIYKPRTGGMSMTTLNSSITELFPCIAFMNGISPNLSVREFYQSIRKANSSGAAYYLSSKDATAGKQFIDQAENGSFQTKVTNAKNITKWLQAHNAQHPIAQVYWGYRAKPPGVEGSHPGDIFVKYRNGGMLGISLKAGTAKSAEPKLNTYVKPIFDFFGKSGEYNAIKDKLWPNYEQIEGIEASDKAFWGTQRLALKTFEFEQENEAEYNRLYDSNLSIIRDELINLFNNNFTTAKKYITQKIAYSGFATPAITVKATETDARLDNTNEKLSAALTSVTSLRAQVGSGKQDFNIILSDGSVMSMAFTTRTNKVGASHKLGQFQNLAVKFNKIS